MSAICGIVRFGGRPVVRAEIESMVESSPWRGPDGSGYWIHRNAGFAHQAFHVTPESVHERQPLVSADGRLILCADARLDNREELSHKLAMPNDPGRVVTDPELIFEAYRKWGERCVEHLLGDFVFSIWNVEERSLFLARDPLGGYGLVYHQSGNACTFASEVAAIVNLPGIQPRINRDSVLRILAGHSPEAGDTCFESVHALPPAHCLRISANGHRLWRYWTIDPERRIRYRAAADYCDHFMELMDSAVACRLRSTGPVGISLSGGCDSTLLAAIAARQLGERDPPERLQSFSWVFDDFEECDERRYILPVTERYGIESHLLNADRLWTFSNLAETEIPRDYFWTNCFMQLPQMVARSAQSAGCRLLVDGIVGDALFGEPSLFAADLIRRGRLLELVRLVQETRGSGKWRKQLINYGLKPLAPGWLRRLYHLGRPRYDPASLPGFSTSSLTRINRLADAVTQPLPAGLTPGGRARFLRALSPRWAQGYAGTRSNPYNRHGLERVSPYLDRRLVEYILAIPTEEVSTSAEPRKIQRAAMRRLLPVAVSDRRTKTSLEPLMKTGLYRQEAATVRKLIEDALIVKGDWVNSDWLQEQLKVEAPQSKEAMYFSHFLHLELWLRSIQGLPGGDGSCADGQLMSEKQNARRGKCCGS